LGFGKSLIQPVFFHTHFEIDTMKAIMVQRWKDLITDFKKKCKVIVMAQLILEWWYAPEGSYVIKVGHLSLPK
jgi:hypothetical protein